MTYNVFGGMINLTQSNPKNLMVFKVYNFCVSLRREVSSLSESSAYYQKRDWFLNVTISRCSLHVSSKIPNYTENTS